MKIHPVGAKLFFADGWMEGHTDTMKLTVAFCKSANMPKKLEMPEPYQNKN
jgi:hypothetical protein